MKLNLKQTIFIGLAFFAVTAFWQMYDNVIPLILKNTFHLGDTLQGVIMAMDNVLALFLLPLFGSLSDRTHSKIGKRMPYILIGTVLASVFSIAIPLIDNSYYDSAAAGKYIAFVAVLGALLFSMGIFRSPAVALMPDLTPKPLRSQGNAIINLMGAVGAIMILIVSQVLFSDEKVKNLDHVDYFPIFAIVVGLMVLSVVILFFTINENKIAATLPPEETDDDSENEHSDRSTIELLKSMNPAVRMSLILILLSVAFWYMGYNAVTTSFTKFAQQEWGMELGSASRCLTIATGVAVVSYIPVGALSSKIGRKKSIVIGVIMLCSAFVAFAICSFFMDSFSGIMYVFLAVLGFAWAAINVNSLPMVVELATGDEIGKFTGYYYSFSMAAQILTPVLSGFFLEFVGYKTLFIYAAFFVFLSLLTMLGVKHGDNRPSK